MSEKQWRPKKEYFEQDERAKTLRNLCLSAVDIAEEGILGDKSDAIGKILDVNAQLHELGISPDMHVIDSGEPDADEKRKALMSDPTVTAEWVAGQVSAALEGAAVSGAIDLGDIEEHDELQGAGNVSLHEVKTMSPKMRKFVVDYSLIGSLRGFLDYEAGPSDI